MSVLIDVQALQSVGHGERGIARYVTETALRSARLRPDLVAGLTLNPDLPYPSTLEPLLAATSAWSEPDCQVPARAYHVTSPFELDVPLARLWPRRWRSPDVRLVVTLYDLIPLLFEDHYLRDPTVLASYRARMDLVRAADAVLCISEATAADAGRLLGVQDEKLRVVHAGVGEQFHPPTSPVDALCAARERLPQLRGGFLLYTGGIDHRKNIDGLLRAYAQLPADVRSAHQLAVVCKVRDEERRHYEQVCAQLGVQGQVLFTGFVSEDLLILLYQSTHLFVFPSLYEGFGLPVLEAQACGAAAIVGDNSSLGEVVPDAARRFPADQPSSLSALLMRLLVGVSRPPATGPVPAHYRWDAVAAATCEVYEDVLSTDQQRGTGARRVSVVSPVPPARTGIADYTTRLVAAMRQEGVHVDVHPDSSSSGGDPRSTVVDLRVDELVSGRYDGVLYCVGNSEHHHGAVAALSRRPGTVLLHDVRLEGLHRTGQASQDPETAALCRDTVLAMDNRPTSTRSHTERFDVLGVQEIVAASTSTLVHSRFAARLVELEVGPDLARRVRLVPFGMPGPAGSAPRTGPPVLVSFGLVHPSKQSEKVLDAFLLLAADHPSWLFALVGPIDPDLRRTLEQAVAAAPGANVLLTGDVSEDDYADWLQRASIGVQLRDITNGETSAAVADCLAAGLPAVVTALGAARELPDGAVRLVPQHIGAAALAEVLLELALDEDAQRRLSAAAVAHSQANDFRHAARAVLAALAADGTGV